MMMSHAMMDTVQQAKNVQLMLFYCWYIVYDVDPTLEQFLVLYYIMWTKVILSLCGAFRIQICARCGELGELSLYDL